MAFEWSLWYVFVLEPHFLSIVYVIVSQKKKKKSYYYYHYYYWVKIYIGFLV